MLCLPLAKKFDNYVHNNYNTDFGLSESKISGTI